MPACFINREQYANNQGASVPNHCVFLPSVLDLHTRNTQLYCNVSSTEFQNIIELANQCF